jgi:hypothetical protein
MVGEGMEGVLVVIQGAAGLVAMVGEEGVVFPVVEAILAEGEGEGEEGLEKAID